MSYIRPIRFAAQLAAIRINEIAKSEYFIYDSDDSSISSSPSSSGNLSIVDDGIARARKNGYDNTVFVVRYLLGECENASHSEERLQIVEKIFTMLNKDYNILIYEPNFRSAVISKVKEADILIKMRTDRLNRAEYNKALTLMKVSMLGNVSNNTMRNKIYSHIECINDIILDYTKWLKFGTLKTAINNLMAVLDHIKNDPNYVV